VRDPQLGWLGFGGDVTPQGKVIGIVPRDGARRRLFIAPAGLWITLQEGRHIQRATYDTGSGGSRSRSILPVPPSRSPAFWPKPPPPASATRSPAAPWNAAAIPSRSAPVRFKSR
jgi:hypothetical protein